jgi:hypothetical protein
MESTDSSVPRLLFSAFHGFEVRWGKKHDQYMG